MSLFVFDLFSMWGVGGGYFFHCHFSIQFYFRWQFIFLDTFYLVKTFFAVLLAQWSDKLLSNFSLANFIIKFRVFWRQRFFSFEFCLLLSLFAGCFFFFFEARFSSSFLFVFLFFANFLGTFKPVVFCQLFLSTHSPVKKLTHADERRLFFNLSKLIFFIELGCFSMLSPHFLSVSVKLHHYIRAEGWLLQNITLEFTI